jgi:hypothetical protein
MVIAIIVTFLSVGNFSTSLMYVIIFLIIGGAIGSFIAFKIPMTAMPELVAGFHSLVGLAAVFVAIAAYLNPEAFNLGNIGNIKLASFNRNVYWCSCRSYNFFWLNNSIFKVKRNNVRLPNHFQRSTFFKFNSWNSNFCPNILPYAKLNLIIFFGL